MRQMNQEERQSLEATIRAILTPAVSDDYVGRILSHTAEDEDETYTLMNDIIEDVLLTSAWEESGYYNDDDVRLSIGRALISRLGMWS